MIKGTRTLSIALEVLIDLFKDGPDRTWSVTDGLPADAHIVGFGMRDNKSMPGLVVDLLVESDEFVGYEFFPLVPVAAVNRVESGE
jgi:hypothetical protein